MTCRIEPALYRFKRTQQPSCPSTLVHFLSGTFAPVSNTTLLLHALLVMYSLCSPSIECSWLSQDDVRVGLALPFRPASCCFGSSVPEKATGKHQNSNVKDTLLLQTRWSSESLASTWSTTDVPLPFINTNHTWRKLNPSLPDNTLECLSRNTIHWLFYFIAYSNIYNIRGILTFNCVQMQMRSSNP